MEAKTKSKIRHELNRIREARDTLEKLRNASRLFGFEEFGNTLTAAMLQIARSEGEILQAMGETPR